MLAHMLHPMPMMAPHMLHDVLHCAAHMHDRRLSLVEPHVTESEDTFTVEAHAPGVAAADVKIEFDSESNSVRIKGSTSSSAHTHFIDFTTAFGHHAVDADKASATVEDGIITIKMPKAPESEAEAATQVLIPVSGTVNEDASNSADGNAYDLTLVAAGFNASEITVEAQKNAQPHRMQQDGLLRITGESSRLKRKKLDEVYRLPRDADVVGATAWAVDGLLTIRVPKRPASSARRIPISLEAAGASRRKIPETAEREASKTDEEAEDAVMV
jgi:HSP20 family molecular chaperone IbpA